MTPAAPDVLPEIDWQRPWLDGWREPGQRLADMMSTRTKLYEVLNSEPVAPVGFIPQDHLPPQAAYEQFIFETSSVPTRDNLHDFFNGLCWMRFPLTKQKLNQLQAAEIAAAGIPSLRGPVRDALTVFDENAAFLSAPQALWDALVERDWRRLFVDLRPLWQQAQLVLFGHALLEKLVYPRKPITAHVYRAPSAMNSIAELDRWVAQDLSASKLAAKPFTPLPVLGVPGWWAENENFSFYDDSFVFRPKKGPQDAGNQASGPEQGA